MADKNDGGDKTEKPTPKRLQDARKKGDVPKSKDLTSTMELVIWLALFALAVGYCGEQFARLMQAALESIGTPFTSAAGSVGQLALQVLLAVTAIAVVPVVAIGLLTEYLHAGPVFTGEKLKPKIENMNPVEGIKRMFTMDNLIEVVKSVLKCAVLAAIGWLVALAALPSLAHLFTAPVTGLGTALSQTSKWILVWTVGVFVLVAVLDVAYQHHSFTKKMRMSLRDIRQEMKESEGDPYIKQSRKQAHEEWSQRNAQQAARQANVLVVNPTHVAIALDYDRDDCPVPMISAKGEDHVARAMREAAEEAGVPIVRNVELARDMLARGQIDEIVPADLFDIIAEVILWAREVREVLEVGDGRAGKIKAPGEDLTRYPDVDKRAAPEASVD
jgi:type III secretion protein U